MKFQFQRSSLWLLPLSLVTCLPITGASSTPPLCSITGNFNGTPIAGGDTIWFNSVFSLPGFDPSQLKKPLTITFTGATITFTANNTPYKVNVPSTSITYDPSATTATTTFNPVSNQWVTKLPTTHLAGNNFLDAVELRVPASGFPGGIQPVTWQGTFSSNNSALSVQWQWAAAVYTKFSTDYNALGVKPVDDNQASAYTNSDHAGTPENFTAFVTGGATGGGGSNYTGSYSGTASCPASGVPPGSCQPASSLTVLVTGSNVTAYVPKGNWSVTPVTGVSVVNIEGSSITPRRIPTPNIVNSCASNSLSGETVCTANNTDVYLLTDTTLNTTLTSGGSGIIRFSGGSCTNCGVAMDALHNRAAIGLSVGGAPGFQILDLGASPSFESPFKSPSGTISEDSLIDPLRNLLLSAAENNNYEIVNIGISASPAFFEHPVITPGVLDSSGEECSTGIALAPAEFSSPSAVFIADLTQATFTPGSPAGTWNAPSEVQTLSESFLSAGASGIAVAQGTHLGVVTGEFGGNALTAIALPATSGSGTPTISDWLSCDIAGFSNGFDPHTVTAYQSPNTGDAIAVLANGGSSTLAIVDLTKMLNPTIVPRTVGGHGCASGTLPATVVSFVAVP